MPAAQNKKYFLHYFYCLGVIVLLTLTSINLNKFFSNQKVLGASIDVSNIQNEKLYWQNLISENPTFIDAYLQLAKVDVEIGNTNEAKNYIEKALSLNPNSTKIIEVKSQLGL